MVEMLESNGKKYPIFTNTFAIGKVQLETGYGFEIIGLLQEKIWLYEPLIWHSLVQGHIVAKEPMELKREDMPLFLSDNKVYIDYLKLIPKFFPTIEDGEVKETESKKN